MKGGLEIAAVITHSRVGWYSSHSTNSHICCSSSS